MLGGVDIKVSGIYAIKNIINDKLYIGQSYNIYLRWSQHKRELNNNTHHNVRLQKAWNKYGEDNFTFYIIEECELLKLDSREIYWIKYYESHSNGYNLDEGGKGTRGYKHTKEEIYKMRQIQSPLCVLQFDLQFNLVNEWIGGFVHASKELHITNGAIKARCEKYNKKMTPYNGYYWVYKDEYYNKDFTWEKYLNNCKIIDYESLKPRKHKKVYQYSLDKKLIRVWNSYVELKENGYDPVKISGICNRSRKLNNYRDSLWCFNPNDINHEYFDKIILNRWQRKVVQLDLNNNIINKFNSIKEAADFINVSDTCVGLAIKKGGTSGGYRWRYA